jgi:hypothetical protein
MEVGAQKKRKIATILSKTTYEGVVGKEYVVFTLIIDV